MPAPPRRDGDPVEDFAPEDEAEPTDPVADEDGPEPSGIWDEDPDADAEEEEEDIWADLEDEALALPRGRVRVGLWERVLLEGVLDAPVVALLDTGSLRTRLVTAVESLGPGRARVNIAGQWREVSGAVDDEGALALSAQLHLGGRTVPVTVRVEALASGEAEAMVRVGRDALSGAFVVDVAEAFLHGARGGPTRSHA